MSSNVNAMKNCITSNTIVYPLLKLPFKQQKKEVKEMMIRVLISDDTDDTYIPQHLQKPQRKQSKKKSKDTEFTTIESDYVPISEDLIDELQKCVVNSNKSKNKKK